MTDPLPLLGILGGIAGVITAIAVLRKVGPEKTDITITSANRVMIGQQGFISELQEQMTAMQGQIDTLRDEHASMRRELREVTTERDHLAQENAGLKRRVSHLEDQVRSLQNGSH
jgi:chromosome segregation ATPase